MSELCYEGGKYAQKKALERFKSDGLNYSFQRYNSKNKDYEKDCKAHRNYISLLEHIINEYHEFDLINFIYI